jgi:hypothetical protein
METIPFTITLKFVFKLEFYDLLGKGQTAVVKRITSTLKLVIVSIEKVERISASRVNFR